MDFRIVWMVLSLTLVISSGSASRDLLMKAEESGSLGDCWSALVEIKSCSNEIILFFLNGQTDIGALCCRSIAIITHNCWPAMLSSLGFTAEQGNILRGYCDYAAAASTPSVSPSIAPALALSVH